LLFGPFAAAITLVKAAYTKKTCTRASLQPLSLQETLDGKAFG